MGGIRRSSPLAFPLGSFGEPGAPGGITAGASFEVFGPLGMDDASDRALLLPRKRKQTLEQATASDDGLVFWLSGHCYRLCDAKKKPDDARAKGKQAASQDVPVPDRELLDVLDRAARQNAADAHLSGLLQGAATQLRATREATPRFLLVETRPQLLVGPPALAPAAQAAKALAPEEKELTFIEVEFVDEDGAPVPGVRYRLELTDSRVQSGAAPKSGLIGADRIEPGLCHLTLLGADDADSGGGGSDAGGGDQPKPDDGDHGGGAGGDTDDPGDDPETHVLDAVVTDPDGVAIANFRFEAKFDDGTVKTGATDADGKLHLDDCPSETCTIRFLDDDDSSDATGGQDDAGGGDGAADETA